LLSRGSSSEDNIKVPHKQSGNRINKSGQNKEAAVGVVSRLLLTLIREKKLKERFLSEEKDCVLITQQHRGKEAEGGGASRRGDRGGRDARFL